MSIVFRNLYSALYASFGVTFFDSLGEHYQSAKIADTIIFQLHVSV
jgi:hypothetical protein